jgi:hypothetical protein
MAASVEDLRFNQLLHLKVWMRKSYHLILKSLRIRDRTDKSNKRADVYKASLVPADRSKKQSRSPISMSDRILAGFAWRNKHIKRIGGGRVDDQILAGYPLIELAGSFGISRCIANLESNKVGRCGSSTTACGDLIIPIQQGSHYSVAQVSGRAYHDRIDG